MPCRATPYAHRARNRVPLQEVASAMFARPVTRKEVRSNNEATQKVQEEWDKLRVAGAWDEKRVREWADVAREARQANKTVHVGRIFDLCVEKNFELPEGSNDRRFKGRCVFQGNNVWDQDCDTAFFQDLVSSYQIKY